MNILAVDVGGTNVKVCTQQHREVIAIPSGPKMTPQKMLKAIAVHLPDKQYDHVSVGFPGPVVHDVPVLEPFNLGKGWLSFHWKNAFPGKPLRMLNDAAMQALGSYRGGRMLFLGLGTGLGSAMVVDHVVVPMELAHLSWKKGKTYEELVGVKAMHADGKKAWRKQVRNLIGDLTAALQMEYVVLGGGNAKHLRKLPPNVFLGTNENAVKGAFLMWQKPKDQ